MTWHANDILADKNKYSIFHDIRTSIENKLHLKVWWYTILKMIKTKTSLSAMDDFLLQNLTVKLFLSSFVYHYKHSKGQTWMRMEMLASKFCLYWLIFSNFFELALKGNGIILCELNFKRKGKVFSLIFSDDNVRFRTNTTSRKFFCATPDQFLQ